jgi:tRNA dimethylallyltransferase
MKTKPSIIAIVGQTATGKTAFAINLAKKIGGEIISADSRQVYRGLALLSGQPTKKEQAGIPHYFIGTENPKKVFSVAEFQKRAYSVIEDILSRKKVAIVVGGTGLYVDALVNGTLLPEVPPNLKLRKKLSKKSAAALFSLLKKLDPKRAKTIDAKNPVRLIRAIEIAEALGKVPALELKPRYDAKVIGLTLPEVTLKKKIHSRIQKRIKAGMLIEAKKLHQHGVSFKRLHELGLECHFAALYLEKKISKKELAGQLAAATWQYAKRQKTWFKRNKKINWITNGVIRS